MLKSNKKEKVYTVEKKRQYNVDDYIAVVDEFNKRLIELLEELCKICTERSWRKEKDDIATYIELINIGTKYNKVIAIQTFASEVYPYYNFIKLKDEKTLIAYANKKFSGDQNDILKILGYKRLWEDTSENDRDYIFGVLQYLCYIVQHYEEIGLATKYVKMETSILPVP
jgi:hypothetical protein